MPLRGKRHFHHVIAYKISDEKTRRGHPKHYIFTLGCGHRKYEFHGPYSVVLATTLEIIFNEMLKEAKETKAKGQEYKVDYSRLPRAHCHECARGKPHEKDAVET